MVLAVTAALLVVALTGPAPAGAGTTAGAAADAPVLEVLSTRADLVSGGDVRVALGLPPGVQLAQVQVSLDDRDVTTAFALRPNGRIEALLHGLRTGANLLRAAVDTGGATSVTVVNHPTAGPVFSGPHLQPWRCQETAVDRLCNEPVRYDLRYQSTSGGDWQPYDRNNPPADVATTTTDQGHTVPFIIRVETGYQNRDQYRIAVLFDPTRSWEPWAPQRQWNHKVLITHGASCGIDHAAGSAPSVTGGEADAALGRGFAVMSTALNNAGHNCNIVTQAESLVTAKERIVERYGDIRYTIATGCSGGSLTQQQVANAYPGIYQGLLPQCSFPDAWSTGQQLVDYNLLRLYFEDPTRWGLGVVWHPLAMAAVEGHPNHVNAIILDTLYWTALGVPTSSCAGVTEAQRYHPQDNPGGVRCTLMDYMINVLGPRPPERWGPQERRIGRGFGGIPLDNVGVQYGLAALEQGLITTEQFVDLNSTIGGGDIDTNWRPERFEADQPALRNAYRSGGVNVANNLDQVAIIDLRGPDPGLFHDAYRTWTVRARIEREHGHFRNHVVWFGHVPLVGDTNYTTEGLLAMDRWLAAVERDTSDTPLADKIVRQRPADIVDRCSQVPGAELVELPGVGRVCEHELVQTRFGTPRTVAGQAITTDTQKCALKPLRRQDYYPVAFTDAQWQRLRTAFPAGVCDWSRPGDSQEPTVPWQTYQDGDGQVIYGGQPMGAAPEGSAGGWTSPAFASWRLAGEGAAVLADRDSGDAPTTGDDASRASSVPVAVLAVTGRATTGATVAAAGLLLTALFSRRGLRRRAPAGSSAARSRSS